MYRMWYFDRLNVSGFFLYIYYDMLNNLIKFEKISYRYIKKKKFNTYIILWDSIGVYIMIYNRQYIVQYPKVSECIMSY